MGGGGFNQPEIHLTLSSVVAKVSSRMFNFYKIFVVGPKKIISSLIIASLFLNSGVKPCCGLFF